MSRGSNENDRDSGSRPRSNATSSAEHRRRLEALFGGGNSATSSTLKGPAPSSEQVFSSPRKSTGRAPSEYRLRLERLRAAREPEEVREAANAFLAYHQLPDDLEILYKLLQHPTEKVVREALGQLSSLLMQGRISGTLLLEEHLRTLDGRAQEDATRSFIDGIRAQIETTRES